MDVRGGAPPERREAWATAVVRVRRAWTLGGAAVVVATVALAGPAGLPTAAVVGVAALAPLLVLAVAFTVRGLAAARGQGERAGAAPAEPPGATGAPGLDAPAGSSAAAEAEEVARRTGEAKEKAELVGRLAGAVAHDVNNTLTVVVANAEYLAEAAAGAEQREAAVQIGEAARHAAAMTQQLLVVSRKGLAQPRPVDLASALQATSTALRRLLPPAITLAVDAPAPAWTCIDPTQLHQLVLNLAMNARDAMPEGGSLRLAVRTDDGEVTLSVADTGVGMDEATQAAAFQPFFTTKPPGQGTGLGLANVQAIVAALGGRVGLASALGRGTVFEIILPACAPAAPPRAEPAPRQEGRGRVLVVDGDVRIRALASTALLGAGYDVLDAPDGPTGLRLAARRRPDLLVTDAVIPGLPLGLLVEGYWAAHPAGRVLVTTAFSDDEKVQAQVRAGELSLLPKPFARAELVAAVGALLTAPAPPRPA